MRYGSVKPKFVVKHEHCGVCGACLLHVAQLHRCPASVDPEILEVFQEQTGTLPARPSFAAMTGGGDREDSFVDRITEARGQRPRKRRFGL